MCMVLSMLPIATFAAEPATETADFTASDSGASAIALLNRYKSFGAADSTWDNGTKTLTLRGIDFTTKAATAVKLTGVDITVADGDQKLFEKHFDVNFDIAVEKDSKTLYTLTLYSPQDINFTTWNRPKITDFSFSYENQ